VAGAGAGRGVWDVRYRELDLPQLQNEDMQQTTQLCRRGWRPDEHRLQGAKEAKVLLLVVVFSGKSIQLLFASLDLSLSSVLSRRFKIEAPWRAPARPPRAPRAKFEIVVTSTSKKHAAVLWARAPAAFL